MNLEEAWKNVLGELEVELSRANFTTWFKDTFIDDYRDRDRVIVGVPTNFTKNWLEKKYKKELLVALRKNLPEVKKIEFVIKEQTTNDQPALVKTAIPQPQKVTLSKKEGLNSNYTFKGFVVGEANRLAHAASRAVAKSPGKSYNPLFIYGGVGLGKTHLLHAIGNRIRNQFPEKKILYVTCEKFTNHFIQTVQSGRAKEFKDIYRRLDTLLIDDVQFISGKEGTQEEFFHTFNALHQEEKQIVISSDRSPRDIPLLEERLRSRFESGMIADIGRPNQETRRAILQTKLDEKGRRLPEKVLNYIAAKTLHSVRELEGSVNRLLAYADLDDHRITVEMAENVLGSILRESEKRVDPDKAIETICNFYEIERADLLGPRRFKEVVLPRQLTMYIFRHELNLSFPQIAMLVKRKDHTTVIHGCDKIEKLLQKDSRLKKELETIKEKIYLG
jgi:chromosomal replication initiator protein